MKQLLLRIVLILFFLLLILNPQVTVQGASTGLLLWFHSIIPSLLPFMILSNLLVALNGISLFTGLFYPIAGRLFGISPNGSYALFTGLVCGYPMGAKTCADLLKERKISREESQYLLCFANNPGPAFLSGYVLQNVLANRYPALPYFLSVYGAPILFAVFLHAAAGFPKSSAGNCASIKKEGLHPPFSPFLPASRLDFGLLDRSIMNGFETVTRLGGYIILFSILSAFLLKLTFLSLPAKALLLGITEITTGTHFIGGMEPFFPFSAGKGMAVCACISFGGLSGIFQTKSVISDTSLSLMPYIGSKMIISLLSALMYLIFTGLLYS